MIKLTPEQKALSLIYVDALAEYRLKQICGVSTPFPSKQLSRLLRVCCMNVWLTLQAVEWATLKRIADILTDAMPGE
jgi:hypothetical protein